MNELSLLFYEAESGEILLDGKNIKDITLRSLRSNIGVVAQDVYLFSGTIRDNLVYGKADATDEADNGVEPDGQVEVRCGGVAAP